MENKTAVIIGSVVLLGVGAFIYFKPKAIPTAGAGTSGAGTSGAGTSSSGTTNLPSTETVLTTPQEVIEVAKKMAEAKDLATKISDLRNKKNRYLSISLKDYATEAGYLSSPSGYWKIYLDSEIVVINNKIKDLDEQIGKLGYMEVNGSITKIL